MANNNIQLDKIKELCNKYRKQLIVGAGVLLLVIVVAVIIGKVSGGKNDPDKLQKNAYKEVNKLIENYYSAYADGKTQKIKEYATPVSDNEVSYIKLFSKYVDSYNVKNVYTLQGVDSNSCLVSVEMEMKFKDVKTTAPGLDFFYITGLESGELYIDNIYSQFNARTKEYVTEEQIDKSIEAYEAREEIKELQSTVQADYEKAIDKDEKLDVMVNSTIEKAVSEWIGTIELEQNQTPPQSVLGDGNKKTDDKKDDEKTDGKEDETKDETDKKPEVNKEIKVTEYVKTKEEVNLREGASTKKDSICMLKSGAKLKVVAMNVWGEWTLVKTSSGKKGYVRNDFLTTLDNKHTVAGQEGFPSKNKKYKLVKETNLLTKMKSSGKVISVLTKGTKVKVITAYENGYSKIKCNGRTGYVLTERLKLD